MKMDMENDTEAEIIIVDHRDDSRLSFVWVVVDLALLY